MCIQLYSARGINDECLIINRVVVFLLGSGGRGGVVLHLKLKVFSFMFYRFGNAYKITF